MKKTLKTILTTFCLVNLISCSSIDTVSNLKGSQPDKFCKIEFSQKYDLVDGVNILTLVPNTKKAQPIVFLYDDIKEFQDGFAKVKLDDKYGYIDVSGQLVIKPQFDYTTQPFSEGMAEVKLENKWGFIDKTGNIIIKPQFDDTKSFKDGLAGIYIKNKWGFIDKSGKIIIKPQFDFTDSFQDGLARIILNKRYGFIDKSGHLLIKPQFDSVESFQEGLAKILVNKKYGFIDKTGQIVIKPQFEEAVSFEEGLARIKLNNKWGLIDKTGNIIINPQFEYIDKIPSSTDEYGIKKDNEIGVLHKNGQLDLDPNFMNYSDYINENNGKYAENEAKSLFDKLNNSSKRALSLYTRGMYRIEINKKHAFINLDGSFITDLVFDYISNDDLFRENSGVIRLKINNKWGIFKLPSPCN